MIPILWSVLLAAAGAPADEPDACLVSHITLEKLWELPDCRFADAREDPNVRQAIKVEMSTGGPLVSGQPATATVTLRNRSKDPVELFFGDYCAGAPLAETHFFLDIEGQRGRAPVEGKYGMIGILTGVDKPCPNPYVRVVLRSGGTFVSTVPFVAEARPPLEGYAGGARPVKSYRGRPPLPEGPLKTGMYVLRVTVSLQNGADPHDRGAELKLTGETKVRVVK